MKDYEEMAADVLARIEEYNTAKAEKDRKMKKYGIPAAAFLVLVIAVLGVWKSGITGNRPATVNTGSTGNESDLYGAGGSEADDIRTGTYWTNDEDGNGKSGGTSSTTEVTGRNQTDDQREEYVGVGGYWFNIPALPMDENLNFITDFAVTGEEITDEEAQAFFKENTWIRNSLEASGVFAENLKIKPHGYCHVYYDGAQGKPFEIRQNFRDYLAYDGDKLISIITLTKENGKLSASPAFGGPWFDSFNTLLQQYKGQEIVFVYAGWMEFFVTPDNKWHYPQGQDLRLEFGAKADELYSIFYHEKAVYVP